MFGLGIFTAAQNMWVPASVIFACWIAYLLLVRLVRCRVETNKGSPCRWLVRGLLGTCDFHVGYKRGLPMFYHPGGLRLPSLMWRRAIDRPGVYEQQPSSKATVAGATAPRAKGIETVALVITAASLVVAIASFVRDVIAG